jgi:hypothetical protein
MAQDWPSGLGLDQIRLLVAGLVAPSSAVVLSAAPQPTSPNLPEAPAPSHDMGESNELQSHVVPRLACIFPSNDLENLLEGWCALSEGEPGRGGGGLRSAKSCEATRARERGERQQHARGTTSV